VSTVENPGGSAAARVLVAMVRSEAVAGLLAGILPEVFPWLRFLPAEDKAAFANELADGLRVLDDLDNLAPVDQLIIEWQNTAEIHADPELHAILSQEADDYGPVPEPVVEPDESVQLTRSRRWILDGHNPGDMPSAEVIRGVQKEG
jgi:hypothetical protein